MDIRLELSDRIFELEDIDSLAATLRNALESEEYNGAEKRFVGAARILSTLLGHYIIGLKELCAEIKEHDTKMPTDIHIAKAMAIYRHAQNPDFLIQAAYRVGFEQGRGSTLSFLSGTGRSVDMICKECLDDPIDFHLEDAESCKTLRSFSDTRKQKGWLVMR